jgi:hypothetical protein
VGNLLRAWAVAMKDHGVNLAFDFALSLRLITALDLARIHWEISLEHRSKGTSRQPLKLYSPSPPERLLNAIVIVNQQSSFTLVP